MPTSAGNASGKQSPEACYPFSAYDLEVGTYKEEAAAYALGRLLQRLEWHQQQWLLLKLESYCHHAPPIPEREPEHPKQIAARYRKYIQALEKAIEGEAAFQRARTKEVGDQIIGLLDMLPTSAALLLQARMED